MWRFTLLRLSRLEIDFGGLVGPPKGLLNRQLVSENERSTTIASSACSNAPPPPASVAAVRAAAAVRSMALRAARGSDSRCVICPLPTRTGVRSTSILTYLPRHRVAPPKFASMMHSQPLRLFVANRLPVGGTWQGQVDVGQCLCAPLACDCRRRWEANLRRQIRPLLANRATAKARKKGGVGSIGQAADLSKFGECRGRDDRAAQMIHPLNYEKGTKDSI